MKIPVEVAFKGIPVSDAVEAAAWKHAEELEQFFDRITSCRVTVEIPHRHGKQGSLYTVRVDLTVPGEEIIVDREGRFDHAHEDVYVAMRDAFRAARRQLEDHARRIRGQVKAKAGPAIGRIARLVPDEDYGFITAGDGREVYFHRNALIEGRFDRISTGDEVRFTEELGEQGPQASSVHVTHAHK